MVIRTGLSSFAVDTSRAFSSGGSSVSPSQIGKVFGVVLNENTPSKKAFELAGGYNGIGTIFYLDYETSKNYSAVGIDFSTCNIAIPLDANIKNYPLVGELVLIVDGPSSNSQLYAGAGQKYYSSTFNLWNNPQQNAPVSIGLGKTFSETADIRPLEPFEGDFIIQGRRGNGLRFGSTVKLYSNSNEWSDIGTDGDPITILTNGYVTSDIDNNTPNIEEVNKEKSSIYLTSTQKIPLIPGTNIINPINSPISPDTYNGAQIIMNSNRIILNSKKDEVLIYGTKNVDLNSNQTIHLNAKNYIHLHVDQNNLNSKILLGTNKDGSVPNEPILLGGKTHDLLLELCNTLTTLAGFLASASAITTEGAIPIADCNIAGEQLLNDVSTLIDKLETITSDKVYTV
jgi:hypothetical protein